MKTAGLSLEQAPPIGLPLRLFLTAPLFAVAAGLLLAWQGGDLLASRWMPAALGATHLIAVGFLGQVMCGALLQMLPVLAGAPVPAVRVVAALTHLLLGLGAPLLAWGLMGGGAGMLTAGAGLSAAGFLVFLAAAGVALARARGVPGTLRALRVAAASLAVTVVLGMLLAAVLTGDFGVSDFTGWVDLHLAWGLLGWVGLLVVGVAYELVPMFHVTPPYPRAMTRWLVLLAAAGLVLGSALTWAGQGGAARLVFTALAVALALFALVTLCLLARRERAQVDATLLHWGLAMASLIGAAAVAILGGSAVAVGVLALVGVGLGLPAGMLFKIVPFLAWFHLQHRQLAGGRFDVRVPHMRSFLPERWARVQLATHAAALAALLAALAWRPLAVPAGVLLAASALLLEGLLVVAVLRYRRIALRLGEADVRK